MSEPISEQELDAIERRRLDAVHMDEPATVEIVDKHLPRLVSEVRSLRARLEVVLALHASDRLGYCPLCGYTTYGIHPCETYRAATEEPVTPPPHSSEGG